MSEDYLWDRSGEPDTELLRLEELLGRLRSPETSRVPVPVGSAKRWVWAVVAAAVLIIGIGLAVQRTHRTAPLTSWQLLLAGQKPSAIRTGQIIETQAAGEATVESPLFGRVDLQSGSRLRFIANQRDKQQQFALDRGTIHALIWAAPAQFIVDTPSAKTVDLGCQYTLHVADDGSGLLTVETGWVAFQWHNLESFIPAGAACRTRPGHGPEAPYFLDAPEGFRQAVIRFESAGDEADLQKALSAARPRDALTLWHLLLRTRREQRGKVLDHLAQLVTLPSTVTRTAVLNGDQDAIDAAWNALELGEMGWWRQWKRQWQ